MLTTDQKEAILRRAGVVVPDFPPGHSKTIASERGAHDTSAVQAGGSASNSSREPIGPWAETIETLYVEYVARRAAKSLRDSEDARQLSTLQQAGQ